mmetsp:Transcript_8215/g.23618  ORF Transcript_8215/g.23618 Transcript_8215/m.23618 type:complete len:762 (-) Transcript_8215:168-2453(-)|eukprot:CAMPEP_0119563216 /NCGR_PEP_ID=MMETSP1352-20130426/22730_1 /TAXON_ID=265584 /ORGANISM="Stauroneis constricta, Strain CCMP1120" /LENGTH=761 /DNA_ID=CAMNT_0007611765 /DNA_START=504 /DNA_END=2789 /DNA_ORIENTATION=-
MASGKEQFGDEGYWTTGFRQFRHNPCMMSPISLFMTVFVGLVMFVTVLFQAPVFLLGLITSPLLARTAWLVEFLYPWGVARWAHFYLIRKSSRTRSRDDDKNRGFHCRAVEQKIEVVKDRVYIHPIPQHLDNVGYFIVCLPLRRGDRRNGGNNSGGGGGDSGKEPIVALMVDCGDADATTRAIELLQKYHYPGKPLQVQAICSTHKHHDHTGGNREMLKIHADTLNFIYGGEVERVPYCTHPVNNGDKLELPKFGRNDMNQVVEIEVAAVPAHTRGSVVYILRTKTGNPKTSVEYLFTGDTMFSAGGGVPFESDIGAETEAKINKSNGNTHIRPGIGALAIERCFAELLVRALPNAAIGEDIGERIIVFPGHEYSAELLTRQFQANMVDSCKWKNFPPKEFFETVSQMYVALHRQSLPHNSGKILSIPTPIKKEICISPQFRAMKRNADLVVRAVVFWHSNFCKKPLSDSERNRLRNQQTNRPSNMLQLTSSSPSSNKTPSKARRWVVDEKDISRDVFTTVYTEDLQQVIDDLASGELRRGEAAEKLRSMQHKLAAPVVNRRPIPGYLPSDKNIYKGVAAFVLLGAPPSAMTLSDSRIMKLSPPIDSNSDRIKISKKRVMMVLDRLGALESDEEGLEVIAMIDKLWNEARYVAYGDENDDEADMEGIDPDEMELGILKWMVYGLPANRNSMFSRFCMPCSRNPQIRTFPSNHPAKELQKRAGDLVAHDVLTCQLCRNAAGCPDAPGGGQTAATTNGGGRAK